MDGIVPKKWVNTVNINVFVAFDILYINLPALCSYFTIQPSCNSRNRLQNILYLLRFVCGLYLTRQSLSSTLGQVT